METTEQERAVLGRRPSAVKISSLSDLVVRALVDLGALFGSMPIIAQLATNYPLTVIRAKLSAVSNYSEGRYELSVTNMTSFGLIPNMAEEYLSRGAISRRILN